ncbi:MAG: ABC transporter substrate-binding protein [Eubacteriaceae bacterium]|nr:ABC transporter substrate-binding protein [Eubacteriaceae bacterium]
MKKIMKKVLVLALTLTMVLSFASCGGNGGGDEGGEATFNIAMSSGVDSLNFFTTESSTVYNWLNFCYDSLIAYDEDYNAIPRAAKEWKASDDGLTWTFNLRDDIVFSDGEPLTSADVKWTYEHAIDSYMYSTHASGIKSIDCPDDYTVVFNCENPKPDMLYQIIPILPEHVWSEIENPLEYEPTELVGSGPFIYSSERSNDGCKTFIRNDNYWGDKAKVNVLCFTVYDNMDAMVQALKLGEVDACYSLADSQIEALKDVDGIDMNSYDTFDFEYIGYNLLDEFCAKKEIRQAIDYCTDKESIIEMSYSGLGEVAYGPVSNVGFTYEPKDKRDFNIDQANAILDAAGYKDTDGDGYREMDGKKISLELSTASERSSWQSATVNLMIENCQKAGIEIVWNPIEKTALWDKCYDGNPDWQLQIEGWGGDADPGFVLCLFQDYETSGYSGSSYQNPEFDKIYNQIVIATDEKERAKLIDEAQAILYEDCPYTYLCFGKTVQAINSDKWTGYEANSHGLFDNERIDVYVNVQPK